MRLVVAVLAVVHLAAVLLEFFEVLLLPRRVRRRWRPVRLFFRVTWAVWRRLADATGARWRHEVLAAYGPLSLVTLFAVWAVLLVIGFGALQWAIAPAGTTTLLGQLYFSGVTFLTLGYGDVTAATGAGKVVSVLEAGTGFGYVAVVIGYLPTLYQLFSQREAHVLRLDARAGSPPTAAELLERHAGPQGLPALERLLEDGERWAASLLESHLSYPMLAYYRSQQDNESWLAALAAVTDASALLVAGLERAPADDQAATDAVPRFQARMTYAACREAIVAMAQVLADVPADARPSPAADRLPPAARARLATRLREAGYHFREADADRLLDDQRQAYEGHLAALAERVALALPPWVVATGEGADNWARGAPGARAAVERAERRERAE